MYSVQSLFVVMSVLVSVSALASPKVSLMRVGIREMLSVDAKKMESFVEREMRKAESEEDDEIYNDMAANVLAQYVLVHPNLTERQAGVSQLRGKLPDGVYPIVLEKAARNLLDIAKDSKSPADQATAYWALTTLVKEAQSLREEEKSIIKPIVETIANTKFEMSKEAKRYSRDSMMPVVEPNKEAKAALAKLNS